MKRFILVLFSVMLLFAYVPITYAADDIKGHWAEKNLRELVADGIMQGYPDGTYQPERYVTRAEFAKLIIASLDFLSDNSNGKSVTSPDVRTKMPDLAPNSWYYFPVMTAIEEGIIKGYDDNTFKPNKQISRQEMATMLVRAVNTRGIAGELNKLTFKDTNKINPYFVEYVEKAFSLSLMNGRENNKFDPTASAKRGEVAAVIVRMINLIEYFEDEETNQEKNLDIENISISRPINVPSAYFVGERRLLVSDNPETLTAENIPTDSVTLWDDKVNTQKEVVDHRVFGWHLNNLGKKIRIGVTIENHSLTNDIELTEMKGIVKKSSSGWKTYHVGLPISEAVLKGALSPIDMSSPVVKANSASMIQSMKLIDNELIGFLSDFSVKRKSGSGDLDYTIRVVLNQSTGDLVDIKLPPVEGAKNRYFPRGTWEASQLQTDLPPYKVGDADIAYSISNGITDDIMTAEAALGNNDVSLRNPGHYGATYKVKIPLENNTGTTKTVRVRLSARGGTYYGAIKVFDKVYLIPNMSAAPQEQVANIIDYKVEGPTDMLEFEIMHSGGAYLPIAFNILTLD